MIKAVTAENIDGVRLTPISIIGMWGLREIVGISTGMAILYLFAALAISGRPLAVTALFVIGLFVWSFIEYILHRWILHWEPQEPWKQKARRCFPSHRHHHDEPTGHRIHILLQMKIIVIWIIVYTAILSALQFPLWWALAYAAGILIGYQGYEYVHVACHYLPMKARWAATLKRHHALHHHRDETMNFGVTTTLWDRVFRTYWRPQSAPASISA